ncbi:MAG: hypothetical protein ACO3JG_09815 [Luteolibacter sp.]
MAYAESWHVRSRSRACAATEKPFSDGETIVTALYPDPESSGYLRRDYTVEAWGGLPDDADQPFSFWKTSYRAPGTDGGEDPMEKLSAEELLRRLVDEDEEHTENTRYILAVMLERQKLLRETDSQRTPSGILRVYEHRKTGEVFLVRDPDIPLDQVEAVQTEVAVLLENNGRMPTPEQPQEEIPGEVTDESATEVTDTPEKTAAEIPTATPAEN